MRLELTISYDVSETEPDAEEIVSEIVAEEAHGFAGNVRERLASAGVRDLTMSVNESKDN